MFDLNNLAPLLILLAIIALMYLINDKNDK